jgi:curved DNA-binding protein CbpA
MKRSEAYQVLNVEPPADRQQVEEAYWELAHEYRDRAEHEQEARQRLLELNEAYFTLTSRERLTQMQVVQAQLPPEPDGWSQAWEGLAAFIGHLLRSTAARWPGRVIEIAALATCLFALTGIALWSGASPLWTLVILAVALLVIRAPWRRVR